MLSHTFEVLFRVEERECPTLQRQLHGCLISRITHGLHDLHGHVPPLLRGVAQAKHDQRVTQSGKARPDTTLVPGFLLLFGQGPWGEVEHVVQHAHQNTRHLLELVPVKLRHTLPYGRSDEARQDEMSKITAAIRR